MSKGVSGISGRSDDCQPQHSPFKDPSTSCLF